MIEYRVTFNGKWGRWATLGVMTKEYHSDQLRKMFDPMIARQTNRQYELREV